MSPQEEHYQTSIKELEAFLSKFPAAEECNEARILLGDALMSQGRMEEGIAALRSITKEDAKLYAEGVFKVGKAYKLMEEHELCNHMADFTRQNPRSPRVAEAVYWMGWIHRQQGAPDAARDVYWAPYQRVWRRCYNPVGGRLVSSALKTLQGR